MHEDLKQEVRLHTIKVETNYDLDKIREEIALLPKFNSQIYLQGDSPDMDPIGKIGYERAREIDANELAFTYFLHDNIPYINSILAELNIVRARVMILEKKECYTWHDDNCERWHLPVKSGNGAFFCYKDGMVNMEADGSIYKADTRRWHYAMNGTQNQRIHIVGAPSKNFVFTDEYDASPIIGETIIKTGIRDLVRCNTVG